jgi:RNA polymerase sigma-70 factor, ECF subfamily
MNDKKINNGIDLKALRRQEKKAFAELVERNSNNIYRLGLKMTGNPQDAEDVLQETFIKAYNHMDGFEGRSKISTWLYRIAVNESLMLLRKRKDNVASIDQGMQTNDGTVLPKQIVDWCCLPEKELMRDEARNHIEDAIKTLSNANRAAFLLRDVEGLSTREAAEALEISESALKVRLMRARMQLREDLTEFFAQRMTETQQ